jgi:hypothetical protein
MEVLQRTANRGSISTGGYEIDNSLKFEADNTEIIYRANESGTNRKTFTVSLWFKRTELGVDQEVWHGGRNGQTTVMGILSYSSADDNLWVDVGGGTGNTSTLYRSFTTRKIRDTSAWYHFVLAVDTTQATEANRMKVWLNGEEVTDWAQHQIPAQDFQCALEYGTDMAWGGFRPTNVTLFSGYLAECHYLDGVTKVQTDFGEFDEDSGIWKPKAYTGTYGNNGCYMKYDDSSALGADSSGNGNTFTLVNIAAADQATDTPTNNFATLNPIHVYSNSALPTISHGATKLTTTNQAWWTTAVANMAITSGKWYFEARSATSSTHLSAIGYGDEADIENWGIDRNANRQCHVGRTHSGGVQTKSYAYIGSDTEGASYGRIFPNGTSPSTRVNYIYTDVIGVAIDADNGYAYWHKNGTYINSGDPTSGSSGTGGYAVPSGTGTNGTLIPAVGAYWHISVGVIEVNFGGYTEMSISSAASDANGYGTFEHAPPSGYYALCTKNLAEYG